MRNVTAALLLSSLFVVSPAIAGAGHDHGTGGHSHGPISSGDVVKKAAKQVKALVEGGKLEKSWADVKPASTNQKAFEQGTEWVVTFKNDKVADAAKQTLYVFYSLDGVYMATNYTGK